VHRRELLLLPSDASQRFPTARILRRPSSRLWLAGAGISAVNRFAISA
jgi:hypothetical protein